MSETKAYPQKGHKVVINCKSEPVLNDTTKLFEHRGELRKAKKITRKIQNVYTDGQIMDDCGERWQVAPTDTAGVWQAIA